MKWIVDTDYSSNSQKALELLVRNKVDIVAVTVTVGLGLNATHDIKAKIVDDLNTLGAKGIPVYLGATQSYINYQKELGDSELLNPYNLAQEPLYTKTNSPSHVDVDNSAAVKIIELVNEHGKNLNILALSSLTNLSLAVLLENHLSNGFNRVYISGGSALGLGNSGVSSEANFRCDPVAAKNVILYYNNLTVIPIDIEENLKSKQFENFGILSDYVSKIRKEEKSILQILAAAIAINTNLIEKEEVFPGDVDTTGKFSRGALSLIKYPWLESEKYNKVTVIESLSSDELSKLLTSQ